MKSAIQKHDKKYSHVAEMILHAGAVVGVFFGALALASSSVFASLLATAFNTTPQTVSSDTLILAQGAAGASGGISSTISNMAPGDTINRYVDVTNSGTMAGSGLTLTVADDIASALTTNATTGLHVQVLECTAAWTQATAVCSGTSSTALANTSMALLTSATSLSVTSLDAGSVKHLRFVITLPASTEVTTNGVLPAGTIQGKSASLTWTFVETQRAASVTNS